MEFANFSFVLKGRKFGGPGELVMIVPKVGAPASYCNGYPSSSLAPFLQKQAKGCLINPMHCSASKQQSKERPQHHDADADAATNVFTTTFGVVDVQGAFSRSTLTRLFTARDDKYMPDGQQQDPTTKTKGDLDDEINLLTHHN